MYDVGYRMYYINALIITHHIAYIFSLPQQTFRYQWVNMVDNINQQSGCQAP